LLLRVAPGDAGLSGRETSRRRERRNERKRAVVGRKGEIDMQQWVANLLRREFKFLHKPLNATSRLLLLASAIIIAVSLFHPLWKMHLVAPQYSDGLDLYIFPYKIHGGGFNGQHLAEINNLNHYIGMKPIQQADFLEMIWMPFVFGLIILLLLRSVVFGVMSNVIDLFAIYTYFGLF